MTTVESFSLVRINEYTKVMIDRDFETELTFHKLVICANTIICDLAPHGIFLEGGATAKVQMRIIRAYMDQGFVLTSWKDQLLKRPNTELNHLIDYLFHDIYLGINLRKGSDRLLFRRTIELLTSPDEDYKEVMKKVFCLFKRVFSQFEFTCWLNEISRKNEVLQSVLLTNKNEVGLSKIILSYTGDLNIEKSIKDLNNNSN